ncbi:MAG: hypothetical protein R3B99_23190 [Polyangiales bacterium]
MNELSPEAKELLAAASGFDDPSADDRARVKRAVLAAAAAGVVVASGTTAAAAAGSAAASGTSTAAAGSAAAGTATTAAAGGAVVGATATSGAVGTALGAKVLAFFVVVGAGTAVVTRPWDEPATTEVVASADPEPRVAAVERPVEARVETPVVEEAPIVEAPIVEAPIVEAPIVEAPIVEAPIVEADRRSTDRSTDRHRSSKHRSSKSCPEPATAVTASPIPRPGVDAVAEVGADTLATEVSPCCVVPRGTITGDTADALAALTEHRERFPRGALSAEREGTSALLRCQSRPIPPWRRRLRVPPEAHRSSPECAARASDSE